MVSWLVCSSPDRAVRVRALAGDIVLCSWAKHFTLTVPLSTQVYKWVPVNFMLGVTLRRKSISSIFLVASCYRNRHKLRPDDTFVTGFYGLSLGLSEHRSPDEKADIVDEFFKRYENQVVKHPEDHGMDYVHAFLVIAKS